MPEIKGQRLFVDLSASQVRKRLKGTGYGVKKVESTGRNRAVIIHTATGDHLRELRAILHDVVAADSTASLRDGREDVPVVELRNIGPTSAGWLKDVGIHRRSDLERLGPAVAYRMIVRQTGRPNRNLLWALAGALRDEDWREIPTMLRRELLAQIAD